MKVNAKKEEKIINQVVDTLGIKYHPYDVLSSVMNSSNLICFTIQKNLIYFYPRNDGSVKNACIFSNTNRVITNEHNFQEITNLDEILIEMVRIYNIALDENIVLDPYAFMLELTPPLNKDYHGNGTLVLSDKAIVSKSLGRLAIKDAQKEYINHFLDHFMGWNFGVSINRNDQLREDLNELNKRVIKLGIRKYAGPGRNIIGSEHEAHNGLQIYNLPLDMNKYLKLK